MRAPDPLLPLPARTLVLAPHPDDEAAGCGVLLQRLAEPAVAYLTDGAPRDPYFWKHYPSRESYATVRRREADAALGLVGVRGHFAEGIVDQELFRRLEGAAEWLDALIAELRPNALLTPAFEGGHPDHDSANLLAWEAGQEHSLPVWEFPTYHRSVDGALVRQLFRTALGTELLVTPSPGEWDRKLRMYGLYESQREVLQHFTAEAEQFRPLVQYDYQSPPHPGVLNYEAWQWGISGSEVAEAFSRHLRRKGQHRTTAGATSYSQ